MRDATLHLELRGRSTPGGSGLRGARAVRQWAGSSASPREEQEEEKRGEHLAAAVAAHGAPSAPASEGKAVDAADPRWGTFDRLMKEGVPTRQQLVKRYMLD